MRCYTPFHDSYDPDHHQAAEHRRQRGTFERGGDAGSITNQPAEASEQGVVQQPAMVDPLPSNWTAFPILEETEDHVLFLDTNGNQCSLPPGEYFESCEIVRMVDRRVLRSGGHRLREHTMRRILTIEENGGFQGLLGSGDRLKTVTQLQGELDDMKRLWADESAERQAAELRAQTETGKRKDMAKKLKAAKRAAEGGRGDS
jgi:hypothetical protein